MTSSTAFQLLWYPTTQATLSLPVFHRKCRMRQSWTDDVIDGVP